MKNIDENYVTIQGWMLSKLNLKGAKLMTFALIYGFCQDRRSRFRGSVSYIAEWTGTSNRQVQNVLNELQNEKLIIKTAGNVNGIDTNEYIVNFKEVGKLKNRTGEKTSRVKKLPNTPEKTSPVPVKKFHPTPEKISPNNTSNNIVDNIEIGFDLKKFTPNYYKKAAKAFLAYYQHNYGEFGNAEYAVPYFENLQSKGEFSRLEIPAKGDSEGWFRFCSKSAAGVNRWARNESKFFPNKNKDEGGEVYRRREQPKYE